MADITDDIDSLFAEADRLIDAGNPEGYGLLGEAHYIQGDYENASVAFEKGIEMKEPRSMYDFALMCYDGLVDNTRYDWYDAEKYMEMCYKTESDISVEAAVWLAEYFLDSAEGGDPEFAMDYLNYAADKGHKRATELLADHYFSLAENEDFKNEEANSLAFKYEQRAYEDDPHEQSYNYGYMYFYGIGTPVNLRLALKLFEEDYEFGHKEGAEALADYYEKEGMKKDAEAWKKFALNAKRKTLERDN